MDCCALKEFLQFLKGYSVGRKCVLACVYFALLMDNLLLTAVVPILPNFLRDKNEMAVDTTGPFDLLKSSAEHFQRRLEPGTSGNHQLGMLLSLKAVVQLVANPFVALIVQKRGFFPPLLFGTLNIIACSLLFACGTTYQVLATARALHGLTSACFTVAGLGIVAANYKEETNRSSALGKALGGGAVGVLLGYPFGGFLYQLTGKTAPFLLIASLAFVLLGIVCATVPFTAETPQERIPLAAEDSGDEEVYDVSQRRFLLTVAIAAIFLSTSVMALLEPCLPLWLLQTMEPERWQLGAVFIPDSCGYLLTTHFLGGFAYHFGRWKAAILAMLLLGICCCLIPLVPSIIYLSVPHFGIGAGIGTVDAALVPLLATLADKQATYGQTFALGQTAVGLAYCLGPLMGDMLVESVGFPNLMLAMGIANLLYTPLILVLRPRTSAQRATQSSEMHVWRQLNRSTFQYSRFDDDDSIDES